MILTTTNGLEGKKAVKYLGLVSGDAILGANVFGIFSRRSGISSVVARRPTKGTPEGQAYRARRNAGASEELGCQCNRRHRH